MSTTTAEIKERYIFRIEPSLIRRCDAVADARFGGNRSIVVREAIAQFVHQQESKIESEREEKVPA